MLRPEDRADHGEFNFTVGLVTSDFDTDYDSIYRLWHNSETGGVLDDLISFLEARSPEAFATVHPWAEARQHYLRNTDDPSQTNVHSIVQFSRWVEDLEKRMGICGSRHETWRRFGAVAYLHLIGVEENSVLQDAAWHVSSKPK